MIQGCQKLSFQVQQVPQVLQVPGTSGTITPNVWYNYPKCIGVTLSFGWLVVRGRRPHSNCVSSNRLQQLSQSVCIGVTLFPSNYNLPPSVGIIYPIATYIFHSHIFPKLLAGYIQYKIVHYPTLCPKGTKKPFQITIIPQVLA